MLDYLADRNYIRSNIGGNWWSDNNTTIMSLLPEGYARIDELQKSTANGKNVLVAMKFGVHPICLSEDLVVLIMLECRNQRKTTL